MTAAEPRRFHVLGVLGQGSFGTVYRAKAEGLVDGPDTVALKLLHPGKETDPELTRRLRDEARMLGYVHHRAIVGVHGLADLAGRWALVMELVDGVDLRTILARGPVPARVAATIAGEVAAALHAAWTTPGPDGGPLHLIHRDIKPSNLFLTARGEVKLLDFGVARADAIRDESASSSTLFGTEAYMSPERRDFVDAPEGDMYALGAVLFELVTGQMFGTTFVREERHLEKLNTALELLPADGAHAVRELRELVARLLDYRPTRRPRAAEVLATCRALTLSLPGPELPEWAATTVPKLVESLADNPPPTTDLVGRTLQETRAPPPSGIPDPTTTMPARPDVAEGPAIPSLAPLSQAPDEDPEAVAPTPAGARGAGDDAAARAPTKEPTAAPKPGAATGATPAKPPPSGGRSPAAISPAALSPPGVPPPGSPLGHSPTSPDAHEVAAPWLGEPVAVPGPSKAPTPPPELAPRSIAPASVQPLGVSARVVTPPLPASPERRSNVPVVTAPAPASVPDATAVPRWLMATWIGLGLALVAALAGAWWLYTSDEGAPEPVVAAAAAPEPPVHDPAGPATDALTEPAPTDPTAADALAGDGAPAGEAPEDGAAGSEAPATDGAALPAGGATTDAAILSGAAPAAAGAASPAAEAGAGGPGASPSAASPAAGASPPAAATTPPPGRSSQGSTKASSTPPPAPTPTGTVRIQGDATTVRLRNGRATRGGGEVPEGDWAIYADFGDGQERLQGMVTVTAGETSLVKCSAVQGRCVVRQGAP